MRYTLEKICDGVDYNETWIITKLTDTITKREIEETWEKKELFYGFWELESWRGEKGNTLDGGLYEVLREDDARCDAMLEDLYNNGWKDSIEFED